MNHSKFNPGDHHGYRDPNPAGRVLFDIAIAVIGVLLILKYIGMLPFSLHFTWPILLITIGTLIAIKNGFRNHAWWILILIGVAHLIPSFDINGHSSRHLVWPIGLVVGGLVIALRPRKQKCYPPRPVINSHLTSDNRLFVDVTFGGRKEIITAKDFKGGAISVTFGGSEINLAQADFQEESIVLDFQVTFGSVELVIPGNWEVKNEIRPTLSNVEDERILHTITPGETKKKLILRGNCTFSNIDIKSY